MKKIGFVILGLIVLFGLGFFIMNSGGNLDKSAYYSVKADSLQTSVVWFGSNIAGKSHTGSVNIDTISIKFNGCDIDEVFVKVDMNTISSSEVEVLGVDMSDKLISHLKNEDFFNVERFPYAKATIYEFNEVIPDSTDEIWVKNIDILPRKYECFTRIHIMDIVKDTVIVAYSDDDGDYFWCPLSLDRTEYSIQYGSNKFYQKLGDNAINDEILVTISINMSDIFEKQGCL